MRLAPLLLAALALSAAVVVAAGPGATAGSPALGDADRDPSGAADAVRSQTATPAGSADGPASTPTDETGSALQNHTPNETEPLRVIAIPDGAVQRTTFARASLDLGPAAGFEANVTAHRIETMAVEERIEAAETDGERSRRLLTALSTVETRVITLDEREQAAIDAYSRGAIDAERFVWRLAAISAEADALEHRLTVLQALDDETSGFSLDRSRVEALRFELRTFGGPVRDRAAAALLGQVEPTRIYVETGPRGVVLTTIVDGTYVREAYRGAVRNREDGGITAARALNVTAGSYPAIWAARLPGGVQATGSGDTFVATVPHTRGRLTAFVDAGSERVFKEYQRIDLATYEGRPAATNVRSGLELVVNRTYPGGPLRIAVLDAETGRPVNATVTISQGPEKEVVVGTTGTDGVVWTISPRGQFTVFAIHGQTSAVFVEVRPTEAPAVSG